MGWWSEHTNIDWSYLFGSDPYRDPELQSSYTSNYNTSTGSADVKGVPPPDGGVPQTRDFWDKVGDAIDNAAKPKTAGETVSDTAKWVAIALAAVGAVYIVHKVL